MQGVICQIRLGADFVVEPNVCSVFPDQLSATPMFRVKTCLEETTPRKRIYIGAPGWAFFIERITIFGFGNNECWTNRPNNEEENGSRQSRCKRSVIQSENRRSVSVKNQLSKRRLFELDQLRRF